MRAVLRLASRLFAFPFLVLVDLVRRMMIGRDTLLVLTVKEVASLRDRQRLLDALARVSEDRRIAGVLLKFDGSLGGWAANHDLREALLRIRESGRFLYAALEDPGNGVTWLASTCHRIFLVPTGQLGLVGVGMELTFFGNALRRLGLQPDFEAAGAYKSFGEPYTRAFPSRENQEAMGAIVDELHEQLVSGIADGRDLPPEQVQRWLDKAPLSADEALEAGFVDQLAYSDQIEEWIKEAHGNRVSLRPFTAWSRLDAARRWLQRFGGPATRVSVVHLQGPIVVENQSRSTAIAARDVVPLLRALRKDDDVGAVVLHVNSPGGSALASDLIWREVDELARAKPVIAAFEDVAASGGYYLAAPAAEILVRPGTLTGSIGVFGGKLVAAEGLQKVGVNTREILAAPNANLFSAGRRFTPDQRERFKTSLQRTYDGFVERVAKGRGRSEEEIEPFCRGRVWTGTAALGNHLADGFGNLQTAIQLARERAGLGNTPVTEQHHSTYAMPMVQQVLRRLRPGLVTADGPGASLLRAWLRTVPVPRWLDVVVEHPDQPLTLLPFDVDVR